MEMSIQKGEAFLCVSEKYVEGVELKKGKPVVVAVGSSRMQMTKEEAIDLADVLSAYKDVAWRVS